MESRSVKISEFLLMDIIYSFGIFDMHEIMFVVLMQVIFTESVFIRG